MSSIKNLTKNDMKNNKKGFIAPVLLAIIALLIIGGGVYVYNNKKVEVPAVVNTQTQETNTQTSAVNTQTNSQTDTSNWRTYIDTNYGFQFLYPQDKDLQEPNLFYDLVRYRNTNFGTIRDSVAIAVHAKVDTEREYSPSFTVDVDNIVHPIDNLMDYVRNRNVNVFLGPYNPDLYISSQYENINGSQWLKVKSSYTEGVGGDEYQDVYFTLHNNKLYMMYLENNSRYPDLAKIISTFKFTSKITQPSITIISPDGGEKLEFSNKSTLSWDYSGVNGNQSVIIGFRTIEENVCWAARSIPVSAKKFDFIPSKVICEVGTLILKLKEGEQYKAQVIVENYGGGKGLADTSNNYFTITNYKAMPNVTVLYPNGGEIFNPGQKVEITWKVNANYPKVNVMVVAGKVADGHYTTNGSMGSTRGFQIYMGSNTGSFDWTVPKEYPSEGKYLIRIEPEGGIVDYSDDYFTIIK